MRLLIALALLLAVTNALHHKLRHRQDDPPPMPPMPDMPDGDNFTIPEGDNFTIPDGGMDAPPPHPEEPVKSDRWLECEGGPMPGCKMGKWCYEWEGLKDCMVNRTAPADWDCQTHTDSWEDETWTWSECVSPEGNYFSAYDKGDHYDYEELEIIDEAWECHYIFHADEWGGWEDEMCLAPPPSGAAFAKANHNARLRHRQGAPTYEEHVAACLDADSERCHWEEEDDGEVEIEIPMHHTWTPDENGMFTDMGGVTWECEEEDDDEEGEWWCEHEISSEGLHCEDITFVEEDDDGEIEEEDVYACLLPPPPPPPPVEAPPAF